MKKVLKLVKGKKDERRECGGVTPSQSGELLSPAQNPEEEGTAGVVSGYGYSVDFGGKDKSLTKLHKAAWQGNLDKLKSALKKVDVDAVDRHGRTALHFAVAQGHPNIVWFLLGNNANTSICDDEGHTPLLKAIEYGHKECMNLLLDRGANVNVPDYTGNTGLHIAVTRAAFDTVSSLLKKAADTDVSNNAGDYPLHIATRLESKDLVDLLLGAGAFVDVLDRENRTPLMLAAKTGNRVLAELFVQRGAHLAVVDSNGWTAQDYAMLGGHESIAAWLSSRLHPQRSHSTTPPDDPATSSPKNQTHHLTPILHNCSPHQTPPAPRPRHDDSADSPEAEPIPPYCQPPRSWEMIQAGMIDENKDGNGPKRRSITALGTLHSRKGSFAEPPASSPNSTLSLNRRRPSKDHNAFAKNRFSLNEEKSLTHWKDDPNKVDTHAETTPADSDWDSSVSADSRRESNKPNRPDSAGTDSTESREGDSGSGTLGRQGTMLGVEEMWVANPHVAPEDHPHEENPSATRALQDTAQSADKSFPPPPTALELGVDLARSIRCLKGLSLDQPPSTDKNLWKNTQERHSLDCLDERDIPDALRTLPGPHSDQVFRHHNPADKLTDVSRRISQQLECYDQALRELAGTHNYHSLPWKARGREEWRRRSCEGLGADAAEKRRKKHMLLAMREVKHALQVANGLRASMEEEVLSPLGKPDEGLDSDDKSSPKGASSGSGGNSPADENPFFGVGRQETVLERNDGGRESDDSETGEESTLWLQDEGQKKDNSDDDVAEICADEGPKHGEPSSFSPLGVLHREMEEESRASRRPAGGAATGRGASPTEEPLGGENEDNNEEVVGDHSPDVSLSSGPIEPLGADKDSGSEPESSHNDASPPHNYALRSQHEWLKSHLRAATSEKNKLEELTAQLTEKAERLQYELADAKEAGKSRDEVIRLLQAQLARMEAAYTKSLEESVQSRLQLTSHEQEILHLKELCYRYQEEKDAGATALGPDALQDLHLRIKALEEEKEKMREEISNLEAEKSVLEGRLRAGRQGESEMADQCQRWKERCEELEEMAKGHLAKEEAKRKEEELAEQEAGLERKLEEAREENGELRAKVESLRAEVERAREEVMGKVEREMRRVERETEERWMRKMKEREEEWSEGVRGGEVWRRESERVRQLVQRLEEQVREMEVKQERSRVQEGLGAVMSENVELKKEMEELRAALMRMSGGGERCGGGGVGKESRCSERAGKVESSEGGHWGESKAEGMEGEKTGARKEKVSAWNGECVAMERRKRGRRRREMSEYLGVNILGEINASSEQGREEKRRVQDLEYLELKKLILSLESKMSNEKNLRHSLENEMLKMRVSLSEKENLEMEVDSLKRKVGRQWLGKSGLELLQYERDLQAKREKYLTVVNGGQGNDYKGKCQLLAKEREKSKQLTKSFHASPKTLLCTPPSLPLLPPPSSYSYPPPRLLLQPSPLFLHPYLKNDLDFQLDKSIHRYTQDSSSTPAISSTQM